MIKLIFLLILFAGIVLVKTIIVAVTSGGKVLLDGLHGAGAVIDGFGASDVRRDLAKSFGFNESIPVPGNLPASEIGAWATRFIVEQLRSFIDNTLQDMPTSMQAKVYKEIIKDIETHDLFIDFLPAYYYGAIEGTASMTKYKSYGLFHTPFQEMLNIFYNHNVSSKLATKIVSIIQNDSSSTISTNSTSSADIDEVKSLYNSGFWGVKSYIHFLDGIANGENMTGYKVYGSGSFMEYLSEYKSYLTDKVKDYKINE